MHFEDGELEPYPYNNNSRLCYRMGTGHSVEMEEEGEEGGEGVSEADNRVYAVTCARQASGFGLES